MSNFMFQVFIGFMYSGLVYVKLYVSSVYWIYVEWITLYQTLCFKCLCELWCQSRYNNDVRVIITHDGRMVCTNQAMLTLSDFSLSPY